MEVNVFVKGLAGDLEHRCKRLLAELNSQSPHPDVADFCQNTIGRLQQVCNDIHALLNSERLNHPSLWCYALSDYQDLAHTVALVEQFSIPVLLRYDDRDHQTFRMVMALIREIGCPSELRPTVTTTSEQYYWAQPELRIIGVPAGDLDGGILGWPDLLHELAHLLQCIWADFLKGFTPVVNEYFGQQHERMADLGGRREDNLWLTIAQIKWGEKQEGTWRVELAADLIATYLIGPSYSWQHIRLAASRGGDPYFPSPTEGVENHPADQARLDAQLAMLRLIMRANEADRIEYQWSSLLKLGLYAKRPPGYELYYPSTLIQKLAEAVLVICHRRGLVPFSMGNGRSNPSIVALIDQAWQIFNRDPMSYPNWERQAILQLKSDLPPD